MDNDSDEMCWVVRVDRLTGEAFTVGPYSADYAETKADSWRQSYPHNMVTTVGKRDPKEA